MFNDSTLQLIEIQTLKQKYGDIFLKKAAGKELNFIVCRKPTINEFNGIMLVYDSLNKYVGFNEDDLYLQLQKICIVSEFGNIQKDQQEYKELLIELGEEIFEDSNLTEKNLKEKVEEQKNGERCTVQYGKVLEICKENPDYRELLNKNVKDLLKTLAFIDFKLPEQSNDKEKYIRDSSKFLNSLVEQTNDDPEQSKQILKSFFG